MYASQSAFKFIVIKTNYETQFKMHIQLFLSMAHDIVFPTAKKKSIVFTLKLGHGKFIKGTISSEKGYFSFAIK